MTTIVNIHKKEPYDVYIGRAGKGQSGCFGNPIKLDGKNIDNVIAEYRAYFLSKIESDSTFKERVMELKDKKLGCFCVPNHKCHGMVIIEYLDGISIDKQWEDCQLSKMNKLKEKQINIFDD